MDKSFNDQELSDIMKEIEALEDDFSASSEKEASPIMEELAQMDEKESIPVSISAHLDEEEPTPASTSNVVSLDSKSYAPKAVSSASTSMSFKVQGNLTLELQFDIGGKVVALEVSESGLSIEMEGGMKFTVPVGESAGLKKAV